MRAGTFQDTLRVVAFGSCLWPAVWLGWRAYQGQLGTNPIEAVTHATGGWTLRFLLMTLAVTPLRQILETSGWVRFRRTFGLFSFFYGSLHLLTYVWLDKFFDLSDMARDVMRRPFITAGFISYALMVPLAVTSTAGWIRRLGGERWRRLHRLVYFSAIAGVTHFYWLVKSDVRRPALYAGILTILLLYRISRKLSARLGA